ncbi:hypothetical protein EIP86_003169 [Pleurotus ostreatoroseus]|nr:hypothetical protein EIP86_003169 [Pleurotus ostreatoroseus]
MNNWSSRDWGYMTTILEPLVDLHTLSLRFSRKDTYMSGGAKNIMLPKLTSLRLYDEDISTGIAQFLDHVSCPTLENIKCWSDMRERRLNQLDGALRKALKTKMDTTALYTSFIPLTIAFSNSCIPSEGDQSYVNLGVWSSEQDSSILSDDEFQWEPVQGSFTALRLRRIKDLFSKALSMFNLTHTTVIWIDSCVEGTPLSTWRRFLHSTPNVHTLRIRDFRELASMLRVPRPDSSQPVTLARLKILNLRGVIKKDLSTLKPLIRVLKARQNYVSEPIDILDRLELSADYCVRFSEKDTQFLRDASIAKVVTTT